MENTLTTLLKETENPQIIKDFYNRYRKKSQSKEYPLIIEGIFQNINLTPAIENEINKILQDEKFLNLDFNTHYYYSSLLSQNEKILETKKLIKTLLNFSTKENLILENINNTIDESNWIYNDPEDNNDSQKIIKIIKNKLKRK